MTKKPKPLPERPQKPPELNGEHQAMWMFVDHTNDRVDRNYEHFNARMDRVITGLFVAGSMGIGLLIAIVVGVYFS